MNITDHKNPPPRRQRGPVYNRSVHKGSLPNEDALSIPQKAGGIQVGRIQEASYRAFYCAHALAPSDILIPLGDFLEKGRDSLALLRHLMELSQTR